MLTLEGLKAFGADTDAGMTRCMNNESFYFRLISMALESNDYDRLAGALAEKALDAAFEAAHALKGVLANLALDPMLKPASEMTELLRARTDTDYSAYLEELMTQKDKLQQLKEEA